MTDQNVINTNFVMRDGLVKTAAQFLQNPKISNSPLIQKQDFLKRKGLTNDEIRKACELAGVDYINEQGGFPTSEFTAIQIPQRQTYSYLQMQAYQSTFLQKVKEFFNVTALIGATIYSAYWVYKKFIEPFLFGRKKKNKLKDSVSELDKTIQNSMKEVKESISKVETDVQRLMQNQNIDPIVPQLVQELKQDLSSLKALLLSRKQFPSAPASIPPWQLDATSRAPEKSTEREDDAGSGSSINNSDSSLEMIREDPPKE